MTLQEIEDKILTSSQNDVAVLGECLLALVEIVKEQQRVLRNHAKEINTNGPFFGLGGRLSL